MLDRSTKEGNLKEQEKHEKERNELTPNISVADQLHESREQKRRKTFIPLKIIRKSHQLLEIP